MTAPAVRGSWTIHSGIVTRWTDADLDTWIKTFDQWLTASSPGSYLPLNDTEARAETPFPYVVYEVGDGVRVSGDSGLGAEQHGILWSYPVTFTAHAQTKARAKQIASKLLETYQHTALCVTPDEWVETDPVGDVSIREGDEHWGWRVLLEVRVTAEYSS
jgi:hypothetical protein